MRGWLEFSLQSSKSWVLLNCERFEFYLFNSNLASQDKQYNKQIVNSF